MVKKARSSLFSQLRGSIEAHGGSISNPGDGERGFQWHSEELDSGGRIF